MRARTEGRLRNRRRDALDYAEPTRLEGRRFVVVGSGSEVGRHATHALSGQGAKVVTVDATPEGAESVAAEVFGMGLVADPSDRHQMSSVFERAEGALSGIDGVVSITGGSQPEALLDRTDEQWRQTFAGSLGSALLAIQLGSSAIARSGAGTVALSISISGFRGAPENGALGASSAALMSVVRSAAVEFGPAGIRVNAVASLGGDDRSYVDAEQPSWEEEIVSITPTKRATSAADVAGALLFLSSPLSGNLNGQTLLMDGGLSALQM